MSNTYGSGLESLSAASYPLMPFTAGDAKELSSHLRIKVQAGSGVPADNAIGSGLITSTIMTSRLIVAQKLTVQTSKRSFTKGEELSALRI